MLKKLNFEPNQSFVLHMSGLDMQHLHDAIADLYNHYVEYLEEGHDISIREIHSHLSILEICGMDLWFKIKPREKQYDEFKRTEETGDKKIHFRKAQQDAICKALKIAQALWRKEIERANADPYDSDLTDKIWQLEEIVGYIKDCPEIIHLKTIPGTKGEVKDGL